MPIYVYRAKEKNGCNLCRKGFEIFQSIKDKPLSFCPKCKSPVKRIFVSFSIGLSKTSLDRRAKEKGFHKLKRVDKGKYEIIY